MPVAGAMIAHQVAGKAVRDATFLAAWPVAHLPAMVIATAVLVVLTVPAYSRLLERFGPRLVVSIGFVASAAAHVAEWQFSGATRWVSVAIYLHVAGFANLLLSGFWSVLSELVDPKTARASFGRIAAAGTLGGLVGGALIAGSATSVPIGTQLLVLAALHLACAIGVTVLGARSRPLSRAPSEVEAGTLFGRSVLRNAPHLKTLALIVVLGTAAAGIVDYLLKARAVERIGSDAELLQFFAVFYVVVQLAIFFSQFGVTACVRRFGLGATISALPAGVAGVGALGLLYPGLPLVIAIRGVEAVLRGSLFRSAYELIFVPMDPVEKRRSKTFLDVTCDRAGEAVGAGIVQLALLTSAAYLTSELLGIAIALSVAGVWLGGRLDALYLRLVERRLTTHDDGADVRVMSETGWSIVDVSQLSRPLAAATAPMPPAAKVVASDPELARLTELRSGERGRVERVLDQLARPTALDIAQVIRLLAWNDLVPRVRSVLERAVPAHVGLLTDALIDPDTDFAIRRRLPRVLNTTDDPRALAGLLAALDDPRFEVRYQCSRAIYRLTRRHPHLSVSAPRVLAVVEKEVSVPPLVWHGHRLIDSVEREDDPVVAELDTAQGALNLDHVFSLLATILPAGPLNVALRNIRSDDLGLRGVAREYLESVLPPRIWTDLFRLLEAAPTASDADARGQSGPPPPATPR